jgi:hypothetical protein
MGVPEHVMSTMAVRLNELGIDALPTAGHVDR